MNHPTPATDPATDSATTTSDLRAAAGEGYTGEWALFCDYTTATGQPALPTTLEALTGFLTGVPAAPATRARRIRAIAAAHGHAGHLLERPYPDAPRDAASESGGGTAAEGDPSRLLAACPTRGWPSGLWGRRDAFLVVLTAHFGHTLRAARAITTSDIDFLPQAGDQARAVIAGRVVPITDDARTCAACATVRWLEALGDLDGLGRGSARQALTDAHAPTAEPHQHSPTGPGRWRAAAQLLPAIDQHGWHDDYQAMTIRALRARLALARARADRLLAIGALAPAETEPNSRDEAPRSAHPVGDLTDVLGVLDALADDADALNARIQALLEPW